ncbi:MAG: hypothetical protein O7G85_04000 [Planctomycetota bacterium]|nr:hypothetical protein [Planctomycetota bacterium]
MTRKLIINVGLTLSIGLLSTLTTAEPVESRRKAPGIILKKITERRDLELVKPDEDEFSMEKPGLELIYDLDMPSGLHLLEIAQPDHKQVKATDSTGRDLSLIKPDFMGKLKYVETTQFYGEPVKGFSFHLALPARSSRHFELKVDLEATTYTSTEEVTSPVNEDWIDLDATLFGKKKVQVKLVRQGKNVQLAVRPGTVKNAIEDVKLFHGDTELQSSFSMWNDSMINYSFEGVMAPSMTVKLKVRRGLSKHMITIALDDQPLP